MNAVALTNEILQHWTNKSVYAGYDIRFHECDGYGENPISAYSNKPILDMPFIYQNKPIINKRAKLVRECILFADLEKAKARGN